MTMLTETPRPSPSPLFSLGRLLATPGAIDLLDRAGMNSFDLLLRHQCGDWGELPQEDAAENEFALNNRLRILSSYTLLKDERIWIITEADRSATTLLLPSEY